MSTPCVLVASKSYSQSKSLVELITRSDNVKDESPHKCFQPWIIDTKYYTADVNVYGITDEYQQDKALVETVTALIVHIDCNSESGLIDLIKWDCLGGECHLEVKLLTADCCDDKSKITLTQATEWCRKHGFEFVVLNPTEETGDDDDDEEEIIKERIGVDRIVEVLQTCVWPNMRMKTPTKMEKGESHSAVEQRSNDGDSFNLLAEEGMDDFTQLFGQLQMMKDSIQLLTGEERKQRAEQMVTAFWKAIGGDDEELEGI